MPRICRCLRGSYQGRRKHSQKFFCDPLTPALSRRERGQDMNTASDCSTSLPLLPLVLDDVPQGLRQALAQEGVPCRDRRQGPAEGRFVLFDSRTERRCPLRPGQVGIDVRRLRGPFPRDPFQQLVDEQAAPHQWQIGGLSIAEEIAAVDKRAVRREAARLRCDCGSKSRAASGSAWPRFLSPIAALSTSAWTTTITTPTTSPPRSMRSPAASRPPATT